MTYANQLHNATVAVKAGIGQDENYGAITPPLYLSSNYSFESLGEPRQYDYSRSGNPTRDLLGDAIAKLERGAAGVITSTGMSAILLVTHLLKPGELLIAPHDCYGGSFRLFKHLADKGHFEVEFIDQTDPVQLARATARKPRLFWVETPSNPLLRIVDIARVCEFAKQCSALVAVDNTFLTPLFQQPLSLGADIVVHSTTKYINGHSDIVGGAVVARDQELAEQLSWWANCLGITASPFDSLLALRGLRTLQVRLKQHQENTKAVLDLLTRHPQVAKVYHPSLPHHPGHQVAQRQQSDFGIMISFELKGDLQDVRQFVEHLSLFSLAESLGGVESLICHPATMTHAAMDPAAREKAGISNQLLRISVGIEHADDLLADLSGAFIAINQPNQLKQAI